MTKQEIQDLLSIISLCADRLGPNQVKELYRIAIFLGFAPKCPGYGLPISNIGDFSWDHIWPKNKGGSNDLHNLQPMHKTCNTLKSDIVVDWQEICLLHNAKSDENLKDKKQKKHKKKKNKEIFDSVINIKTHLHKNNQKHR